MQFPTLKKGVKTLSIDMSSNTYNELEHSVKENNVRTPKHSSMTFYNAYLATYHPQTENILPNTYMYVPANPFTMLSISNILSQVFTSHHLRLWQKYPVNNKGDELINLI